jgi:hypothetical protein
MIICLAKNPGEITLEGNNIWEPRETQEPHMQQPYCTNWIPVDWADCLALLRSVDYKLGWLTDAQLLAMAEIYNLRDSRSITERIIAGKIPIPRTGGQQR